MTTKQTVLNALRRFVAQRPGLEFGNYGDVKAYRAEMRQITKDRHQAEELLRAVEWRDSITAEQIVEAAKHAYSGRLSIETVRQHECNCGHKWTAPVVLSPHTSNLSGEATQYCPKCNTRAAISSPHQVRIDYCTGQYFPTEYRRAVCAVLSAVLWDYWRDSMPESTGTATRKIGFGPFARECEFKGYALNGRTVTAGDYLRHTARAELGRSIASRWFN